MARLKGPILFTGGLGNIRSIYNKKLKRYILSTKGGASKELIKNSPAFVRTRENMSEFTACGKWASQVRKGLLSISHLFFGYYFSEIVKLANKSNSATNHIQKDPAPWNRARSPCYLPR